VQDRSWRVRHVVAENFVALQQACGLDLARTELATMLVRLLKDQEKEVGGARVLLLGSPLITLLQ
jgi:hypothetical protein